MGETARSVCGALSIIAMCLLLALGIWVTKSWLPTFGLIFVVAFSARFPWMERKESTKKVTSVEP